MTDDAKPENLERLISALQLARIIEDDDSDEPARARVRKSLAAVMDFLRAEGVSVELRAPFQHLYAALEDVADGRRNDLLKPAERQDGKPKKRSFYRQELTMASAAVTILREDCGWQLNKALNDVARDLGLEKSGLGEFRKNIRRGRQPDDVTNEYYRWRHDRREHYPDLSPEAYVQTMIETAKRLSEKG